MMPKPTEISYFVQYVVLFCSLFKLQRLRIGGFRPIPSTYKVQS